jgi:hypothetical protein
MVLKIAVLLASILQVVAAGFLNIGSFQDTERTLQVFIQPAGWAFSIWGLIYTLAFIYAVYQVIPKYDNATLHKTRIPALVGFLGSIAWLYFAGMSNWMLWLTAPVLFLIAISFVYVVKAPDSADKKQTLLSKKILFPYAAWTGIACWLNVQTLLNDQLVVTNETINLLTNGFLFACVVMFTMYYFKKTQYSAWYGGVMVWAGVGVVSMNVNGGLIAFAMLGGLFTLVTIGLYAKTRVLV